MGCRNKKPHFNFSKPKYLLGLALPLLFTFLFISVTPHIWARALTKEAKQEINSLYKEAKACYSQNDLSGAEDVFRQILSIDPDQKKARAFIDQKIPAREKYLERVRAKQEEARLHKERQQRLNDLYEEALTYYREDDLIGAGNVFEQILGIDPDHQRAKLFIEKKIPARQEKLQLLELVEQERGQRNAKRRAKREQALRRKEEREAQVYARKEEITIQEQKQQQIKTLYKEALSHYSQDELARADDIFKLILSIEPKEKKAKLYIDKKIAARIEKLEFIKQKEEKLEAKKIAREGERLRKEEERKAEKRARQEERLRKEAERKAEAGAKKEEARILKYKKEKTDALLKEAIGYYRNNELIRAEETFEKVIAAAPNEERTRYQNKTRLYLDKKIPAKRERLDLIRQRKVAKLRKAEEKRRKEEEKTKSDYITLKRGKTAKDILKDADHLYLLARYEEAIVLYNWAYDIARNKVLKKEILHRKKKARALLRLPKEKQEEVVARREERKNIKALYKEAVAYYSQDELAKAEDTFREVLRIDPDHQRARMFVEKKIPARQEKLELLKLIDQERETRKAKKAAKKEERLRRKEEIRAEREVPGEAALRKKEEAKARKAAKQEEALRKKEEAKARKAAKQEEALRKKEEAKARKAAKQEEALRKKEEREAEKEALLKWKQEESLRKKAEREAKARAREEERLRKKEEREAEKEALLKWKQEEALRKKEEREAEKEALLKWKQEERLRKKAEREVEARAREEEIRIQKENKQEINALYKEGLTAYSQNELSRAESLFEQILNIDPEHKKASYYIELKIPAKRDKLELKRQKEEEVEARRREIEEERSRKREEALRKKEERKAEKEALLKWKQEESLRKKAEREAKARAREEEIRLRKENKQEINALYKEALTAYSQNELSRAESLFEQILNIDPEHKKASYYIELKIPAKQDKLELIRQKEEEAEARRREIEEERAHKREEAQAKKAAKQEEARRKKEISAERKEALREETVGKQEERQSVAFLYEMSLNYFGMGRYSDALHEANKILVLEPNNEKAIKLIEQIKEEQDKR